MKTAIILTAAVLFAPVFFSACDNRQVSNDGMAFTVSDGVITLQSERMLDSLVNDAINQSKLPDDATPLDTFKKSIEIIKYYTSSPNSACGVDCNIIWKNLSKKTIKYATFTVVPYNAVNDEVEGRYDNGIQNLSVTGPVKTNATYGYGRYWECVWYNCTIDYMKIIGIEIEYVDGSKISTSNVQVINSLGYVRNSNDIK